MSLYKVYVKTPDGRIKLFNNFENYEKSWIDLIDETIKKHGSWENRINHKRWYLMEVA